jgi:hypothetical protein
MFHVSKTVQNHRSATEELTYMTRDLIKYAIQHGIIQL